MLGLVVKSPSGFPIENPYLAIVKRALVERHRWGKELGIVTRPARRAEDNGQGDQADGPWLLGSRGREKGTGRTE